MRYVETLTKEAGNRLHARTERDLKAKVASSTRSQHKGYPDEVGHIPYVVVNPSHEGEFDSDRNLCSNTDPKRATTFTACLGFPHLTIRRNARGRFTLNKLVSYANCDSYEVFHPRDETVETVLHERERLRMAAIAPDHRYNIDDETTLTADPVDKILINAARTAERRDGEVSAEGVREVLTFGRNKLDEYLPFDVDTVTDEFLSERIRGKTCSPPIPQNDAQRDVLLYYMDNPDATIAEVIDATGYNRGNFETFRLNRPSPDCYDRSYIESLEFEADELVSKIQRWMQNSPHPVYRCSECEGWSYSKQSLAVHKINSKDHETSSVLDSECPTSSTNSSVQAARITEESDADADELINLFSEIQGESQPDSEQEVATPSSESESDSERSVEDVPSTGDATDEVDEASMGDGADGSLVDEGEPAEATEASQDTSATPQDRDADIVETQPDVPETLTAEALLDASGEPLQVMADSIGQSPEILLQRFFTTLSDVERERILNGLSTGGGTAKPVDGDGVSGAAAD